MLYKSTDLKQLAITSGVSAVFVLILVASNDLGGALLYFFDISGHDLCCDKRVLYFCRRTRVCGAWNVRWLSSVFTCEKQIVAWLDPLSVIDKAGYQVCQSLFAIGTGGLFGFGTGTGTAE